MSGVSAEGLDCRVCSAGLKSNPWLHLNAVVTMFDSGGSSGQLRDELGVLPPGDVLKCALALARNEGEARRVLLSRLPTLETNAKLAGHTGGNLLLSMMEQYSGNFLSAVDGLRGLLGCKGRVWPVSVEAASLCVEYGDGSHTRGEFEVDLGQANGQQIHRLWLEPAAAIHPDVARAISGFDAVIIGPGSFFTSLMPPLLVRGVKEALADVRGPVILIANLLTEGSGMAGFTAADAARWVSRAIERPIDVVIANTGRPSRETLLRYAAEQKEPLEVGALEGETELVTGPFWTTAIARHDRRRLSFAVWSVLSATAARERSRSRRLDSRLSASGFRLPASGSRLPASGSRLWPLLFGRALARSPWPGPSSALPAFIASARLMIESNIFPVSPPSAGRLERQMSGSSADRISAKSPPLLTLNGANSAMSIGPAHSSLCLISSHERPSSALPSLLPQPLVRTRTQDPLSL